MSPVPPFYAPWWTRRSPNLRHLAPSTSGQKSRQATIIGWPRGSNESLYGILGTRGGGSRTTDIDTAPLALLVQTDAGIFRRLRGRCVSMPREACRPPKSVPRDDLALAPTLSCGLSAILASRPRSWPVVTGKKRASNNPLPHSDGRNWRSLRSF